MAQKQIRFLSYGYSRLEIIRHHAQMEQYWEVLNPQPNRKLQVDPIQLQSRQIDQWDERFCCSGYDRNLVVGIDL